MHSLRRQATIFMLTAALLATSMTAAAAEQSLLPASQGAGPTIDQIETAMQQLRLDPNLEPERKVRTLKWLSDDKPRPESEIPAWLLWLQGLLRWIASSARAILWILAGLLAALVAVYLLRLLRSRAANAGDDVFNAPSHVRDLDIRPESLPTDIGAAALALWQQGEQRRALALLYRGLLSRMVHTYRAPAPHSTTEGECIALARRCLSATAGEFSAVLVTTWQRAVYGGQMPATAHVQALCAGFAPTLDEPSANTPAHQGAAS
jgi:hypothetical protein